MNDLVNMCRVLNSFQQNATNTFFCFELSPPICIKLEVYSGVGSGVSLGDTGA